MQFDTVNCVYNVYSDDVFVCVFLQAEVKVRVTVFYTLLLNMLIWVTSVVTYWRGMLLPVKVAHRCSNQCIAHKGDHSDFKGDVVVIVFHTF